ncbi:MAG: peptidoglycan DD-metalloendopeptidase family protein [Marivibrio sp.]|uniref:peptidoglycan DD-metalloendopeptidase family protein n=1 Tax=Marivibrio sp. TaxID=2039719 RepID=UPI0032EBD8A2
MGSRSDRRHHEVSSPTDAALGTGGRAPGRLRRRVAHLFRERELLLRSDDRVRYVRLKPWLQMTAAGCAFAVLGWGLAGTGLSLWQKHRLADQQSEIVEAKIAYERVRGDLETYRLRVGALARDIFARQDALDARHDGAVSEVADGRSAETLEVDLEELAEISARIEGAFDRIATDLDLTEADRRRIVQSRAALHERIAALETALARAESRAAGLDEARAALAADLAAARAAGDEAAQRADSLARLLSDAQTVLAATERRESALRGRVTALAAALESAERETVVVEEERDALSNQLSDARAALADSRALHRATGQRIESVVRRLAEVSARGLALDADRPLVQALEVQARGVMRDLQTARRRADSAETTLSEVVLGLARLAQESGAVERIAASDGDSARAERISASPDLLAAIAPQSGGGGADAIAAAEDAADPVRRAETLLGEIAGLHESQRTLVERLSEETKANLQQTEAVLKLAGLDVEAMLKRVGYGGGQGGPLVRADFASAELGESFADDVKALEGRIQRWRALQEVVRCTPLIAPVDNYHVTSSFGKRKDPFTGKWAQHEGVDLGGWPGTPVMAAAPGVVTYAARQNGYGNKVVIDHGCGVKSIYAHLRKITVKKGQRVDHRDLIGKLGSTGRSTGPHVHYEIQVDGEPLDPEKFIEAGKHVFKI